MVVAKDSEGEYLIGELVPDAAPERDIFRIIESMIETINNLSADVSRLDAKLANCYLEIDSLKTAIAELV